MTVTTDAARRLTHQPKHQQRRGLAATFLGTVTIGLTLVGCSVLASPTEANNESGSSSAPSANAVTTVEALPVVSIGDRPGWAIAQEFVADTYTKYAEETSPDNAYNKVPQTEAGLYYAHDFIVILTDYKGAFAFGGVGTESTNVSELDAKAQSYIDEVTEYERKFLAGEDLGVTITITQADGTVYESEGANGAAPEIAEEFSRNFAGTPDASGNYVASAQELASQYGVSLSFDYTSIYAHCMHSEGGDEFVVASYCHATPQVIYVNTGWADYPTNLNSPGFIDTIKHELAHRAIGDICDTASPPITGTANEGVANSFAVLFLGANREELNSSADAFPQYATSEATDELARGIHDSQKCV
jgi:hypothetical protein